MQTEYARHASKLSFRAWQLGFVLGCHMGNQKEIEQTQWGHSLTVMPEQGK